MLTIVKVRPGRYYVKNESGFQVGVISKDQDGFFYLFPREEVSWSSDNLSWIAVDLNRLNNGEEV